MTQALRDVALERAYQRERGYDAQWDDKQGVERLAAMATDVLTGRDDVICTKNPSRRRQLVIAAALAVAAVEALDRQVANA